jgi:putative tricarboxylic transport membrane protein
VSKRSQRGAVGSRGGTPWTRWNFNHSAALVVAALAAGLFLAIPYVVAKPEKLFGRALSGLNPALFPRLVLGTMFVLALWYFFSAGRLRELNLFRTVEANGYFNIAVTIACVVVYAFALPALGYIATGIALMLVLTVFYGNRNHLLTVGVSVLVPVAIYHGATRLLKVSLPEFPFF